MGKSCENQGRLPTEATLQRAWNALPRDVEMVTRNGSSVRIISTGDWNIEAGPDFKNAKIEINNQTVAGDIEIHRSPGDWFAHGHHLDPAYDNVVLHVVANNNTGKAPDIPTVILRDGINGPTASADMFANGGCAWLFRQIDDDTINKIMVEAGLRRFEEKTALFAEKILAFGASDAFWSAAFEALGYKRNQTAFAQLFRRFKQYSSPDHEAVIWGEAGLLLDPNNHDMPKETRSFMKDVWSRWWLIRRGAEEPVEWRRSSVRPMNSPERRVAAATGLIRSLGTNPIEEFARIALETEPTRFWSQIKPTLTVHHPVWDGFSTPRDTMDKPAAVLGASRALDLTVNVVLPAIAAFAKVKSNPELADFARETWLNLPKTQGNRTVKTAAYRWLAPPSRATDIINSAAAQQGAIFLHRRFCERNHNDCDNCGLDEWLKQVVKI